MIAEEHSGQTDENGDNRAIWIKKSMEYLPVWRKSTKPNDTRKIKKWEK